MNNKIELFEYFLYKLVNWFCSYYKTDIDQFNAHRANDLSKLKVFKLHFFTCTKNDNLINIFNSFHALPYGHVESDVYNSINQLQFCEIDSVKLKINNELGFLNQKPDGYLFIDSAIEELKNLHNELISIPPFDLVEISHKWFSWRYTFEEARNKKQFSGYINPVLIMAEEKYYSL